MTIEEALEIIEELSVLKFFPSGSSARGKLATMLDKWCGGDIKQARWLLDSGIDGMDEYPGPETLRKLIADKFKPAGPMAPYSLEAGGIAVVIECVTCHDTGTVEINGRHAWCSCAYAVKLREDIPNWLDLANSSRFRFHSRLVDKKRAEDTEAILGNLTAGYGVSNEN